MPLPKTSSHVRPDPRKILLTTNGVAEAVGAHPHTITRALLRGDIEVEAWVDFRGKLAPLFLPAVTIRLARILPPIDHPQTIT